MKKLIPAVFFQKQLNGVKETPAKPERLELFAALLEANRTHQPVTWRGRTRAPMNNQRIYPPTESGTLMTWFGVSCSRLI